MSVKPGMGALGEVTNLIIRVFLTTFFDLAKPKIERSGRSVLGVGRLARSRLLTICVGLQPLGYRPVLQATSSNSSSESRSMPPPRGLSTRLI